MKPNISQVAKFLGMSRATVTRALSGRAGVSPEKRKMIFDFLKEKGYDIKTTRPSGNEKIVIAAGVPSVRAFFWERAIDGMHRAIDEIGDGEVELQLVRFGGNRTSDETIHVMRLMMSYEADGYIVVPIRNPMVKLELEKMAATAPVATFNERFDFKGRFMHVGPDDFTIGKEAAGIVIGEISDGIRALVIGQQVNAAGDRFSSDELRSSGFRSRILQNDFCNQVDIVEVPIKGQLSPAMIARSLSNVNFAKYNCIYICDGIVDYVLSAFSKMNVKNVMCICQDVPEDNDRWKKDTNIVGAYINQDIEYQGYIATKMLIEKIRNEQDPYFGDQIIAPYMIKKI